MQIASDCGMAAARDLLKEVDPLTPWEHRLRLLLDSTDEGVFGINLAGDCMFINRAAARWITGRLMPMRLSYDIAFDLEYLERGPEAYRLQFTKR